MPALLLAPHADDETLFAFYTLLRDNAHVLVCLDPGGGRIAELDAAMTVANRYWTVIDQPEKNPDWMKIRRRAEEMVREGYDTIIAPAYEDGGHEQHNEVAKIAATLGLPITSYYTYVRGSMRTARGQAVMGTGAEMALKRQAMDCYASQIADPKTAPWFDAGWQLEHVEVS